MRAPGIQAASQRDALGALAAHAELDEQFKRIGAPGSHWNDEERERWEAELEAGSLEAAERRLLTPNQAAAYAVESITSTPVSFESMLDEELEKYQPPEHANRLRDEAVQAWEEQNPESR